jgi:predicted nucleic acid-binding protein
LGRIFLDTNIIIYANDRRDPKKQAQARSVVSGLMRSKNGVLSTQVLQEYASVAISKLGQKEDVVLRQLKLLETLEVVSQTPAMIRRAVELKKLYGIQFWDACIIANAEAAGCDTLYSEDLNTGQFYSGIRVKNPLSNAE